LELTVAKRRPAGRQASTPMMARAIDELDAAAPAVLRPISAVAADCSSTAAATVV
jgi:hypothetical protein